LLCALAGVGRQLGQQIGKRMSRVRRKGEKALRRRKAEQRIADLGPA
jgi:hypothetical protein